MSDKDRVVWSEGLFLQPHHLQQQNRYLEGFVESRCSAISNYGWGFTELAVDQELLGLGQLALRTARGVLPDGTPFNIPEDHAPPPAIEVDDTVHGQVVFLTLPLRQPGLAETAEASGRTNGARYCLAELDVRDNNAWDGKHATVQVGQPNLRLMVERQPREGHACLGVARVEQGGGDQPVRLDEGYIPTCVTIQASTQLAGFASELASLLRGRANELAGRVSEAGQGGVAEIADFMLLQLLNRYEPIVDHMGRSRDVHPEPFYQLLASMLGELATFTRTERRPGELSPYRHTDLQSTFVPIIEGLRDAFSTVTMPKAIPIPLEERKYGVRVAPIQDRTLLRDATFVLAVKADMSSERIRQQFPAQSKIGPVEQIRQLVNMALPGITLHALPVAPRQIPYHAGYTYFELDRSSKHWHHLEQSAAFALHVGGEFPGLELQFWAIRE